MSQASGANKDISGIYTLSNENDNKHNYKINYFLKTVDLYTINLSNLYRRSESIKLLICETLRPQ